MEMTGAQILMKVLKEEGADTIFGFPGGAVIDIYDELAKTDIRHVLVRHEQGAGQAAGIGYARAGKRVGVCLVTSGPGATNTVTGIASAFMDSIPIVVISGQVPTHLIGNNTFKKSTLSGSRVHSPSTTIWSSGSKTWPERSRRPFILPAPVAPDLF